MFNDVQYLPLFYFFPLARSARSYLVLDIHTLTGDTPDPAPGTPMAMLPAFPGRCSLRAPSSSVRSSSASIRLPSQWPVVISHTNSMSECERSEPDGKFRVDPSPYGLFRMFGTSETFRDASIISHV